MQSAATLRARRDFVQEDHRSLTKPPRARGRASPLITTDQVGVQTQAFPPWKERAVQLAIALVEGKWRVPILRQLQNGSVRLGELRRRLSPVSKKVLNQHLRQMEKDGLIVRTSLGGKVPHVEYSLANPLGCAVLSLLQVMAKWSSQNLPWSAAQQCLGRLRRVKIDLEILNSQPNAKTFHRVVSAGAFGTGMCAVVE